MKEEGKKRAFLLTLDALLSLTIVVLATYSYVLLSSGENEMQKAGTYDTLARDYLRVKYMDNQTLAKQTSWSPAQAVYLDPQQFYLNTGAYVSEESAPKNALFVGHAEISLYPTPCGCNSWSVGVPTWTRLCTITVSEDEADGCLQTADGSGMTKKEAWVWKE